MGNQQSKRPSAGERPDEKHGMERDGGGEQSSSAQQGSTRRASDQDERFGPGSSPQGRDNDMPENAPSREDPSRSRGGQSDDSR